LLAQTGTDGVIVSAYRCTDAGATGFHPVRMHCAGIDRRGTIAWTRSGLSVTSESPGGTLAAINDRNELVVLDEAGRELGRQEASVGSQVVGWRGNRPLFADHQGVVWVEPFFYALFEHHLHRYDDAGNAISRVPIPRAPFEREFEQRPVGLRSDWTTGPDMRSDWAVFPAHFDLDHDPHRGRLIANNWSMLAWTMALSFDGAIEWISLVGDACCNDLCYLGDDVIVHTSSCGGRLSFMSPDGRVFRTQDLGTMPPGPAFLDGRDGVCIVTDDRISGFDGRGESRWILELAQIEQAIAHAGMLYVVTVGPAKRRELAAFDLS
jgi:hypothetical protein